MKCYTLREAVEERLLTGEIWAETGWRIEEFDGRPYYFICYRYKNYVIGLGMDLQEQFAGWLEGEAMEDCLIWLFGEERAVVWNGLGDCRFLESTEEGMEREVAEEMQAEETGQDSVWVQMTVGGKENRVCLSGIRMGQVVPAAYRVLLYLSYASLVLLGLIWILIRRQVINPLQVLQEGLKALDGEAYYRIEDTARTEDFAYIYQTFNKMADDILLSHERELQLYQTQLDNLKLQVNPHMLLNSLTTIYSLVQTRQYPTIQKFVMDLVEYFRYCLRENDGLVTLESELRFVENYMGIQKVRYPGEMSYGYQAEPGVEKALLPPLLIQNFVENAVKYARIPDAVIEILVNVRREEGKLYVSVCDTGQGMAEKVQKRLNSGEAYTDGEGRKHIGVWNCRRRLELFYGAGAMLRINSSPGKGTQVWMELPYSAQGEVEEREEARL